MKRRISAESNPLTMWEWSGFGPLRVQLTPAVRQQLGDAVRRETHVEIGGFLLGRFWQDSGGLVIRVEETMPVKNDNATQHEFTFSGGSFIKLEDRLKQGTPAGLVCVGWYHTHPGHGIFFSAPDQTMHRERFPHAWQVGLVLEPTSSEAGFFYWREDKQLGPVQLKQVPGLFDWATWQLLDKSRPRVKTPWSPQRWALGTLAFGLLSLGGSTALAAWGMLAPASAPQASLLPFKKSQPGYVVHLTPGTWRFRVDGPGKVPAGSLIQERQIQAGQPFTVSYQDIRAKSLGRKPLRLWLQRAGSPNVRTDLPGWQRMFEAPASDGPLLAVDLPELWDQLPSADGLVRIPLGQSTRNFGRFYLRDVTGLQGGDRLIEIPHSLEKAPGKKKESRT